MVTVDWNASNLTFDVLLGAIVLARFETLRDAACWVIDLDPDTHTAPDTWYHEEEA